MHTSGLWLANASEVYSEETGKTVARCDIGGRDAETDDNARFVASAPAMLQATVDARDTLIELQHKHLSHTAAVVRAIVQKRVDALDAVITQARGE